MQHNIKLVERNSQLAPKADRLFAAYTGCGYGQKLHRWFPLKVDVWWEPGCNKSNWVFSFTDKWAISSVGRTLALQAGCQGFESLMCPLKNMSPWDSWAVWQFGKFTLLAPRKRCRRKQKQRALAQWKSIGLAVEGHAIEMRMSIIWAISSVGRTQRWQRWCHRFESDMCPLILV